MKKLTVIAVALLSFNALAADKVLIKTKKPPHIVVAKDGSAMSQFSVLSTDFSERGLLLAGYWTSTLSNSICMPGLRSGIQSKADEIPEDQPV